MKINIRKRKCPNTEKFKYARINLDDCRGDVHKRSRSGSRISPTRSLRNAVLANMLQDEASLCDTLGSLYQVLGCCFPGRDRVVPSCQVALTYYVSEELTVYLHRELYFIICGAVPPLDQCAFMACYFITDLI